MTYGRTLQLQTKGFSDIRDITREVEALLSESGVREEIVTVSAIGSTASVTTIE